MQEKILITSKGNGKNFYAYIKGFMNAWKLEVDSI